MKTPNLLPSQVSTIRIGKVVKRCFELMSEDALKINIYFNTFTPDKYAESILFATEQNMDSNVFLTKIFSLNLPSNITEEELKMKLKEELNKADDKLKTTAVVFSKVQKRNLVKMFITDVPYCVTPNELKLLIVEAGYELGDFNYSIALDHTTVDGARADYAKLKSIFGKNSKKQIISFNQLKLFSKAQSHGKGQDSIRAN